MQDVEDALLGHFNEDCTMLLFCIPLCLCQPGTKQHHLSLTAATERPLSSASHITRIAFLESLVDSHYSLARIASTFLFTLQNIHGQVFKHGCRDRLQLQH